MSEYKTALELVQEELDYWLEEGGTVQGLHAQLLDLVHETKIKMDHPHTSYGFAAEEYLPRLITYYTVLQQLHDLGMEGIK